MTYRRNFAFITDGGLGGIIVVDLSTGNSHRALDNDPSVMPDKNVKIVIDGKPILGPTGETPAHINESPTYNNGKSTRKMPYEAFSFKPSF